MKKRVLINLGIIYTTVVSTILVFGSIMFGINELGWFDRYDGWHKEEIPMPYPLKGGTIYMPDNWSMEIRDDWVIIVDDEDQLIGIQIYKGFWYYDYNMEKTIWVSYEENPMLNEYDYANLVFEADSNGSNNCVIWKSPSYYKLDFVNVCTIENDPYKGAWYPIEFLMVGTQDIVILDKIRRSYVWGDIVKGVY